MKSQEEDGVSVLGMRCCLPTAVPGLLVCFGLVTFTRVLDVFVSMLCEVPGSVTAARFPT